MTHIEFAVVDIAEQQDRSRYVPNRDAAIRAEQSAKRIARRAEQLADNKARARNWRAERAAKRFHETVTVDSVSDGSVLDMLARIAK